MDRTKRKTIFCDIDGTLFYHRDSLSDMISHKPHLLNGVLEKFQEWREKDYFIILTTARPEGTRIQTELQLKSVNIFYDKLIMGLPVGPRVVINDMKPNGMITAEAINLKRNSGLSEVDI